MVTYSWMNNLDILLTQH